MVMNQKAGSRHFKQREKHFKKQPGGAEGQQQWYANGNSKDNALNVNQQNSGSRYLHQDGCRQSSDAARKVKSDSCGPDGSTRDNAEVKTNSRSHLTSNNTKYSRLSPASKSATSSEDISSSHGHHGGGVLRPDRNTQESLLRRTEPNSTFTNDSKFSKLVRRVLRSESDQERKIYSCQELHDYVRQPSNEKALLKVWENLLNLLEKIFHDKSRIEVKNEVARCIGAIGSALGYELSYVEWIFDKYNETSAEQPRILLLKALLETLVLDNNEAGVDEFIVVVMSNVQTTLENAELPDLLRAIVDLILHISQQHPNIFSSHFRDTMDILIGWHIDPTQNESLNQFTSDTLISLHSFWLSDTHFSITLLGQFLEDMEAYTDELISSGRSTPKSDEEMPSQNGCYVKVVSLIRVFTTVMKSLGDYASPKNNSSMTWEFLTRSLSTVLKCVTKASSFFFSVSTFVHANSALVVLTSLLRSNMVPQINDLFAFIDLQSEVMLTETDYNCLSLLVLVHEVIQSASTQFPLPFVPKILGPNSPFCICKMSTSSEVQKILMKIYHCILSVKNVPLLEEVYRYILGDLHTAYKVLIPDASNLVENNPWDGVAYTRAEAEVIAIFNLCALSEIGNVKNSIIGMWALKPSFFELLTIHLSPTCKNLITNHPAVQYTLTFTLYSHCSRHSHYVGNSKLMSASTSTNSSTPSTPVISSGNCSPIMSPSTTSGHLTAILTILIRLFENPMLSYDCRMLCLKWTRDFINYVSTQQVSLSMLCRSSSFLNLSEILTGLMFSLDSSICLTACQILIVLINSSVNEISSTILKKCYEGCVLRLSDASAAMQDACTQLLSAIPLNFVSIGHVEVMNKMNVVMYQKKHKTSSRIDKVTPVINYKSLWTARRSHMMRGPTGTFHTHNFQVIMSFLLNNFSLRDHEVLRSVFYSCQRSDKNYYPEDKLMSSFGSSSRSLLWFWALWEAAQFCVLSKLRTPFGKPHETFTSIEMAIKNYAKEVKNVGNLNGEDRGKSKMDNGNLSHTRVMLLLNFVDNLEKLMYNAYEGCAVAMPSAPKLVKTFFRTNKATCQEWIHRMRHAIAIVARNAGQNAIAVEQGYQLLHEMMEAGNANNEEFEKVLICTSQALIALKTPEPILGLYIWCKEKIGKKYIWLKAAVDEAAGRYEAAIHEYKCILHSEEKLKSEQVKSETVVNHEFHRPVSDSDKENISEELKQPAIPPSVSDQPDSSLTTFLEKQITDCYCKLSCWTDLLKWKESSKNKFGNNGGLLQRQFSKNSHLDYIRALSKFEKCTSGNNYFYNSKHDVMFLNHPDGVTWNNTYIIQKAERALMAATLNYETVHKYGPDDLKRVGLQAQKACDLMVEALKNDSLSWPSGVQPDTIAVYQCATAIRDLLSKNKIFNPITISDVAPVVLDKNGSVYNHALFWVGVWQHIASKDHDPSFFRKYVTDIQLLSARIARKHQNDKLSQRILLDHADLTIGHQGMSPANLISMLCMYNQQPPSEDVISVQREGSKLLYSLDDSENAVEMMSHSILNTFQAFNLNNNEYQMATQDINKCKQLNSRSFITLAKWLQHDSVVQNLLNMTDQNNSAATILDYVISLAPSVPVSSMDFNDIEAYDVKPQECSSMDHPESCVGHLYHLAITQCPTLAKSWFNFANWCYKWGRKAVDTASEGIITLQEEEKQKILNTLPKEMNEDESDTVLTILSQIHVNTDNELTDLDQDIYGEGADTTRRQLLSLCPTLATVDCRYIEDLIEIWRCIQCRTYYFYVLSAKSYFKYLQLNGQKYNSHQDENDLCEDGNVTATLRLLRLVVKHASELRDILEKGLAVTPTAPWKGIIPQLFSRLNHPEAYVRQSISDLLCRIAQDAPHLIIFPAVVGCSGISSAQKNSPSAEMSYLNAPDLLKNKENKSQNETNDEQSDDSTNGTNQKEKAYIMQNCFSAMVETLAKQDTRTISEVKMFVSELRRITLLWDELWLGTLNQHQTDISRKVNQLESEVKKVETNPNLSEEEKEIIIREKHKTILKPSLFILEQLQEITSQPAETPHEKWFQNHFSKLITDTLTNMRDPPNPSQPQLTWNSYKLLVQTLQQSVQKRVNRVNSLTMAQISPKLASMTSTMIAMPGIHQSNNSVVTIECVHNTVSVLPTKTKPKKIVLHGSDGKRHTYLFKGLEDLHLDERIMQFLSIVNNMFAKTKNYSKELYHARNYSVTPLGPRSGLIQWVDGATAIFGLYKRWQHREAMVQNSKNQSGSTIANVLRPSEIYYNKLTPMLKEKGISNLDNRKEWPVAILKQVLCELMKETPSDLLAKEIWCSCSSANEWWNVTQTYAQSTAVISIIGYIIGLGDRHLDNVLVDFATGEVVHIDYNVCFEKGKNLRVPEKVPFRMTPNIKAALGVTGVEGTFRVSCEHVLKTMRKGRETLLTLLEAFVYDPLVDWTPGGTDAGYAGAMYGGGGGVGNAGANTYQCERLNMEREIAYNMLAMRVAEMKTEWLNNKGELQTNLVKLKSVLSKWIETKKISAQMDELVVSLKEQSTLLQGIDDVDSHSINSLSDRYAEFVVIKETMNVTKAGIEEKLKECNQWQKSHESSLIKMKDQVLVEWFNTLSANSNTYDCFSVVTEFLLSAGQSQLLSQCEQVEKDLKKSLEKQRIDNKNLLQILLIYSSMVSQYPASFAKQNRNYLCEKLLTNLNENFTSSQCENIKEIYKKAYGPDTLSMVSIQETLKVQFQLHSYVTNLNTTLLECVSKNDIHNSPYLIYAQDKIMENFMEFLESNGAGGKAALLCIVLNNLSSLNKKLLMMESAAAAAGDRVVDLTSLEGDWFFHDVYNMNNNAVNLIQLIKPALKKKSTNVVVEVLDSVQDVISQTQELSVSFKNVVLPETMKLIQGQEANIMVITETVNHIIEETNSSLDTIITQMESHMRCIIMEMESPYQEILAKVEEMKQKYQLLVERCKVAVENNPGFFLFTRFNNLFADLQSSFKNLLVKSDELELPRCWRKVDIIREAKSLQAPVSLQNAQAVLTDIFLLKRLRTIQQVFAGCAQMSNYLYGIQGRASEEKKSGGNASFLPFDESYLYQPVKIFISEFISKQLLGLPSQNVGYIICTVMDELDTIDVTAEIEQKDIGAQSKVSLEDLTKKTVDCCIRMEMFTPLQLTQINNLVSNIDVIWKNVDSKRWLDMSIKWLKACLERAQLQLTRHQWFYEDHFVAGNFTSVQSFSSPIRSTVMSDIKKAIQALVSTESSLSSNHDRFNNLVTSVEQRLKWAAGANPSLTIVLEQFESNISNQANDLLFILGMSKELMTMTNGILHFEAHRTQTSEAFNFDKSFMTFINWCASNYILIEGSDIKVSPIEEQLILSKPLKNGEKVTNDWISAVKSELQKRLEDAEKSVLEAAESSFSRTDLLKNQVMHIRNVLSHQHRLMSDIRNVLKTIAKHEEMDEIQNEDGPNIQEYTLNYKMFSESISGIIRDLLNDESLDVDYVSDIEVQCSELLEEIRHGKIYEDLISLAHPLTKITNKDSTLQELVTSRTRKSSRQAVYQEDAVKAEGGVVVLSPCKPSLLASRMCMTESSSPSERLVTNLKKPSSVTRDPRTGKALQERNLYAMNVWKRVKMKLDGRDPDPSRRMSVAEQVDHAINEATSMDNLAVLYEGWTPWV